MLLVGHQANRERSSLEQARGMSAERLPDHEQVLVLQTLQQTDLLAAQRHVPGRPRIRCFLPQRGPQPAEQEIIV